MAVEPKTLSMTHNLFPRLQSNLLPLMSMIIRAFSFRRCQPLASLKQQPEGGSPAPAAASPHRRPQQQPLLRNQRQQRLIPTTTTEGQQLQVC